MTDAEALESRVATLEKQLRTVASLTEGGYALKYVDPEAHAEQERVFWHWWSRSFAALLVLAAGCALMAWLTS